MDRSDLDLLAVDGLARIDSVIAVLEASIFDDTWTDLAVRLELLHLAARARRDFELAGVTA